MATEKALDGTPYAGNPHIRFDEGEFASCTAESFLRRPQGLPGDWSARAIRSQVAGRQ